MSKDIFISYSRRDQEFVTRLASDLNAQVAGVWFDHSAIQIGENWHDQIMEGIHDCKAFILVLSPDAAESKYVREEVNKALELGKVIFPVIYRPGRWTGEFESVVKNIQTLDLRSGSYTDNFSRLVDGLVEAGAAKATHERPFLHQSTNIPLNIVFSKIPGWAFAWSLGWVVFWIVVLIFLAFVVASQQEGIKGEDILNFILILVCSALGGFAGGLLAGLFTMLALRPNAPSISWKHMAPTIRIWGISGPLGMIVSGVITAILIGIGAIAGQNIEPDCSGGFGECVGQIIGSAIGEAIGFFLIVIFFFSLFVIAAWFLTGMFAGWQVTHHIRRLEPGITTRQAWGVAIGWGCGAIVAAVIMFLLLALISRALEL